MTKAEREWCDAIVQIGCIACRVMGFVGTPAEVHHLLSGGRRIGHLHSIPLCPGHHRSSEGMVKIGRHPFKRDFEEAYGTEAELLEKTRALVADMRRSLMVPA